MNIRTDVVVMENRTCNFILCLIIYVQFFIDVDECSLNNGLCEHNCRNLQGSYKCHCRFGFSLDTNGHTCSGTCNLGSLRSLVGKLA